MKKAGMIIVCSVAFVFTGCFKEKKKTCECTTTYNDPSYSPVTETIETSQDCSFYDDAYSAGGSLSAVKTCEEI